MTFQTHIQSVTVVWHICHFSWALYWVLWISFLTFPFKNPCIKIYLSGRHQLPPHVYTLHEQHHGHGGTTYESAQQPCPVPHSTIKKVIRSFSWERMALNYWGNIYKRTKKYKLILYTSSVLLQEVASNNTCWVPFLLFTWPLAMHYRGLILMFLHAAFWQKKFCLPRSFNKYLPAQHSEHGFSWLIQQFFARVYDYHILASTWEPNQQLIKSNLIYMTFIRCNM